MKNKFFRIALIPIILAVVGLGFSVYIIRSIERIENAPANTLISLYDAAKYIANDIAKSLNFIPQVTVNKETIVTKQLPIMELATLKLENVKHTYYWSNRWLGSEKTIEMNGYFDIKSGFDLNKFLNIDINQNSKSVTITFPPPKILSVELKNSDLSSENGWINKINDKDRNEVINQFIQSAKSDAKKELYYKKAKQNLENIFKQILEQRLKGFKIIYQYQNEPKVEINN